MVSLQRTGLKAPVIHAGDEKPSLLGRDGRGANVDSVLQILYNCNMKKTPEYTTTRIWVQTLRMLKLIAAMTNESMVKVMDRLAQQELERLKGQEKI